MLTFPQLMLYPITKTSLQRTAVNVLGDGRADVLGDPDAASLSWELKFKGMTLAEWNSVEALLQATSGRWQTFTFLDPVGNLLAQSENFSVSPWANGALIQLTPGISDPLGTTRATRMINAGIAAEAVAQTLSVPATFEYCLSVWAKTIGGSSVTLALGTSSKTFALTSQWQRISFSGGGTTFGAQLDAGASVDLFGMQVEAQLAPSDYKMTGVRGGVYSNARFAEDKITVTAQGTDVYDAVIRIVNTEN
jgi:hypothetical protein